MPSTHQPRLWKPICKWQRHACDGWQAWLKDLVVDLGHLLRKKEIFWELQEIAKENPKILSPGAFFKWMCTNYIATVSPV